MAWLEKRNKIYHIGFLHGGRHNSRSLKTGNERKAEAAKARLEDNLLDVDRGQLEVPSGADQVAFLLSDGKVTQRVVIEKQLTLGELFERYKQELPEGAKEGSTRYTENIHIGHLLRLSGAAQMPRGPAARPPRA